MPRLCHVAPWETKGPWAGLLLASPLPPAQDLRRRLLLSLLKPLLCHHRLQVLAHRPLHSRVRQRHQRRLRGHLLSCVSSVSLSRSSMISCCSFPSVTTQSLACLIRLRVQAHLRYESDQSLVRVLLRSSFPTTESPHSQERPSRAWRFSQVRMTVVSLASVEPILRCASFS